MDFAVSETDVGWPAATRNRRGPPRYALRPANSLKIGKSEKTLKIRAVLNLVVYALRSANSLKIGKSEKNLKITAVYTRVPSIYIDMTRMRTKFSNGIVDLVVRLVPY